MTRTPTPPSDLHAHVVVRRDGGFVLDVELHLPAGTTTALLGPNAAGKSTLLRSIAGLIPLDEGTVRLGESILDDPGADIFVPPQDRRAGVVFLKYLLFEHLDVEANVLFAATVRHGATSDVRRMAQGLIEALELSGLESRRPSQLSGGQRQRVAIARALASMPKMLLLDEPLAALDLETKGNLRRLLGEHLDDFRGPRLLITHDPVDAFLLADSIAILENGRITQVGPSAEVARRPATRYAAALAGLNLLMGENSGGTLSIDDSEQTLATSDTQTNGPVLVTINPNAIALHESEPHGSPRNSWATSISSIEGTGDIIRVTLEAPLPLNVDVTPAAVEAMDLAPGQRVWASVKATEVSVNPT